MFAHPNILSLKLQGCTPRQASGKSSWLYYDFDPDKIAKPIILRKLRKSREPEYEEIRQLYYEGAEPFDVLLSEPAAQLPNSPQYKKLIIESLSPDFFVLAEFLQAKSREIYEAQKRDESAESVNDALKILARQNLIFAELNWWRDGIEQS